MKSLMSALRVLGYVLRFPFVLIIAIYLVATDLRWKDVKKGTVGPREKMKSKENVEIKVFNADGSVKKLFKRNLLGDFLFRIGIDVRFFATGVMVEKLSYSNLITNVGLADVAGLINGSTSPASFEFIGIGTGTGAASATDTTLGTEINEDGNPSFSTRGVAGTVSRTTTTVTNDTATIVRTFTIGAFTPAVTEAGLFNAATGGTLFARRVFAALNLVDGNNLQITYNVSNASA